MPISKENAARYPSNWRDLVDLVRQRSGNRCEGSPAYPDCTAENGQPHPVTQSVVVLTTGHLDHDDLDTQDIDRLRHWCQRCHLTYDAKHHAINARITRRKRKAIGELF